MTETKSNIFSRNKTLIWISFIFLCCIIGEIFQHISNRTLLEPNTTNLKYIEFIIVYGPEDNVIYEWNIQDNNISSYFAHHQHYIDYIKDPDPETFYFVIGASVKDNPNTASDENNYNVMTKIPPDFIYDELNCFYYLILRNIDYTRETIKGNLGIIQFQNDDFNILLESPTKFSNSFGLENKINSTHRLLYSNIPHSNIDIYNSSNQLIDFFEDININIIDYTLSMPLIDTLDWPNFILLDLFHLNINTNIIFESFSYQSEIIVFTITDFLNILNHHINNPDQITDIINTKNILILYHKLKNIIGIPDNVYICLYNTDIISPNMIKMISIATNFRI